MLKRLFGRNRDHAEEAGSSSTASKAINVASDIPMSISTASRASLIEELQQSVRHKGGHRGIGWVDLDGNIPARAYAFTAQGGVIMMGEPEAGKILKSPVQADENGLWITSLSNLPERELRTLLERIHTPMVMWSGIHPVEQIREQMPTILHGILPSIVQDKLIALIDAGQELAHRRSHRHQEQTATSHRYVAAHQEDVQPVPKTVEEIVQSLPPSEYSSAMPSVATIAETVEQTAQLPVRKPSPFTR